jgi:oxygen-dependent protoporphyrinogen oxidase
VIVIGGGLAGLASARRLARAYPQAEVTLIEAAFHLGGKVLTETIDGFVIEAGPEAMVTSRPRAIALCQELGLGDQLISPLAGAGTRIWHRGRLHALPEGMSGMVPTRPGPLARSGLFSPLGKLRMALEPVVPPRRGDGDETVRAFVERRLGREAYQRLVEPLVGGIHAGDPGQLSLAATMPHLRALEARHGGLVLGMVAHRKDGAGQPRGGSPFVSLAEGLSVLIEALERDLATSGVHVRLGSRVTALAPDGAGGYQVGLASGEWVMADAVVSAVPPPIAAGVVAGLDPWLAEQLRGIPHGSVVTVALGYRAGDATEVPSMSGYLVPLAEARPVRACTIVSNKWLGRVPDGAALFRLSLGGAGRESVVDLDDDALVGIARAELDAVLGVASSPVVARVYRWREAMPQYVLGHRERVAAMEARIAARWPRLALAGGAWHGAGMADTIESGERAADRVLAAVTR